METQGDTPREVAGAGRCIYWPRAGLLESPAETGPADPGTSSLWRPAAQDGEFHSFSTPRSGRCGSSPGSHTEPSVPCFRQPAGLRSADTDPAGL